MASGTIRPSGLDVELFNEAVFTELRAYAQVPDDFVNSGWSLAQLQNGGGKGGTLMARVGHSYVVKELSKGDHQTLLSITSSYAQHVRSGETLLCPVYLHFREKSTGRFFFAMRNAIGPGPFAALYDLKGCADDKTIEKGGQPIKAVHKRIWNVGMWCGTSKWTQERHVYHEGKVQARHADVLLTGEQRALCLRCIERDTAWLARHRLMDYSLLVAVKDGPAVLSATGGVGPSALGQRPLAYRTADGREVSVYITIIDFLQKWTMGKRVARVIKCMERDKATIPPALYARRFYQHFSGRLVEVQGEAESDAHSVKMQPIAPPAGDTGDNITPEERLNSRPMPADNVMRASAGPAPLHL